MPRLRRHLQCTAALIATCLILQTSAHAQSPQPSAPQFNFDVVSIKPSSPDARGTGVNIQLGIYHVTNLSLRNMIMYAYHIRMPDQVLGLTGWAASASYDISAKSNDELVAILKAMPVPERQQQQRLMVQAMLQDRFHLKAHLETKEMPVFALVLAKGGSKLKQADPNDTYTKGIKGSDGVGHPGTISMNGGNLIAQGVSISSFAQNIAYEANRNVIDKTGLTGTYDFTLQWSRDDTQGAAGTDTGPSLFTALQEQLGLRLESTKGPVDVVVVDHVEMPSEN